MDRVQREGLRRITVDFDGSVLSTRKHAEGSAVGFDKHKKGARSYYPLHCAIAQTGQVFDVLHRSGNVMILKTRWSLCAYAWTGSGRRSRA